MEQQDETARRASARVRVLERLQAGPALNTELNALCFRYGARIFELRRDGVNIIKTPKAAGVFEYSIRG